MSAAVRDRENRLTVRIDELRTELRQKKASRLAEKAGAQWEEGRLVLPFWGEPIAITVPEFTAVHLPDGTMLNPLEQALLVYSLHTADGAPLAGEWISFSELPDGRFYTAAFQGYTGNELSRHFGNDLDAFAQAATTVGGFPVPFADRAFAFPVLPLLAIMVACWQGDEDFSPSYRILFDGNTHHHMPTDGCAILGSNLTQKLKRAYNKT
jgi:hypothetical protein